MGFPLLSRWLGPRKPDDDVSLELGCGGRVSLRRDDSGATTLSIRTAPDETGHCHTVAVPLSDAERLELGQALETEPRDDASPAYRRFGQLGHG